MNKKVNISPPVSADSSVVTERLSACVKQYRSRKKISLDELSRLANVSKGMLVEIEACRANPSIALLCRLATAMGVSVAELVDVASKPSVHIIAAEDIPRLWIGKNGGSARLLAGTGGPGMVELWEWEMYAGEIYETEAHPEGTSELLHVVQGTLLLTLGKEIVIVHEGCSAIACTDVPHSYAGAAGHRLVFTMTVIEHAR